MLIIINSTKLLKFVPTKWLQCLLSPYASIKYFSFCNIFRFFQDLFCFQVWVVTYSNMLVCICSMTPASKSKSVLSNNDDAGHFDTSQNDVYINCALSDAKFTPFILLYASLASSSCSPKPFLQARNFSKF